MVGTLGRRDALSIGDCGAVPFEAPKNALSLQRRLGLTIAGEWAPFPNARPPRARRPGDARRRWLAPFGTFGEERP